MNKKVFVISRKGCHYCELLEHELYHNEKIKFMPFNDIDDALIFEDFTTQFKITRYPAIQIDDGKDFITLHGDPDFVEPASGAGSNINKTLFYFEDTVNKQISRLKELLKD